MTAQQRRVLRALARDPQLTIWGPILRDLIAADLIERDRGGWWPTAAGLDALEAP